MKALVRKELREVFGIAAVALACYLALAANLMGARVFDGIPGMPTGTHGVPFVNGDFLPIFVVVSIVFALALGFRQSAWEAGQGTYLFLLHRPLPRHRIFLLKLATGLAALLACASVPIVLYGLWASVPGHHPSPFEWSMAGRAVEFSLAFPLLYFSAFLCGLRPARWWGTRLLPLVAGAVVMINVVSLPWWTLGLPLALLAYGVLGIAICHVARVRDYA